MQQTAIIHVMCSTVEDYIRQKKNIQIQVNRIDVMTNADQLNKLIDAYNHITHQGSQGQSSQQV